MLQSTMKPGIGQYVKRRNYYLDNKNALNIFSEKEMKDWFQSES
jgi:hypothetical protein